MSTSCPECGYPLNGNETACPECGCPVEIQPNQIPLSSNTPSSKSQDSEQTFTTAPVYAVPVPKTDWAQYFYECGVIGWEAFKKYCVFTGRSSRREFWSFWLLCVIISLTGVGLVICILPMIGVSIRRMHDINKCGWWSICPIVCFFLYLKQSDEGVNIYGDPNPAKNLL